MFAFVIVLVRLNWKDLDDRLRSAYVWGDARQIQILVGFDLGTVFDNHEYQSMTQDCHAFLVASLFA